MAVIDFRSAASTGLSAFVPTSVSISVTVTRPITTSITELIPTTAMASTTTPITVSTTAPVMAPASTPIMAPASTIITVRISTYIIEPVLASVTVAFPTHDPSMVSTSASTSYASVVTPLAQATTSEVVPSFEEEFIMGLIDVFYTHPEKSLSLVLRGSTISFNTLTYMLDHTIENILEVGWLEQICPLEQLAQNFKSDATELRRICEANFNPLIEEKLARIS